MCKSCQSGNQGAFNSEVCIHFPGLENLDKPAVFTYPKIVVCLDCGHAEFSMPENELPSLVEGRYLRLAENSLAKGDP
jgi:tRNA U54 and U55 pseudouridine synthase Pus10